MEFGDVPFIDQDLAHNERYNRYNVYLGSVVIITLMLVLVTILLSVLGVLS